MTPFTALPNASDFFQSQRALGYSPESAIADLIDNCIAAEATLVQVVLYWDGDASWVAVLDNGVALDADSLKRAMMIGAQPTVERSSIDLGRFGFGLKTASLSMGRRVSLRSRIPSECLGCWDLDHQVEFPFEVLDQPHPGDAAAWNILDEYAWATTAVLVGNLDRLLQREKGGTTLSRDSWLEIAGRVEEHLAMVFHRYVERLNCPLVIRLSSGTGGGAIIEPWNPFLVEGSSVSPVEYVNIRDEQIQMKGLIMPHRREIPEDVWNRLSGPRGWVEQQGFYVYRRDRMLIAGTWLGLRGSASLCKTEGYQLARLSIDIPVELDEEWEIDVMKTKALPPARIRNSLRGYANRIRGRAREVFFSRARASIRSGEGDEEDRLPSIWEQVKGRSKTHYRIRGSHPILIGMLERLVVTADKKALRALLQLVEQQVPVERIWLDVVEGEAISPCFDQQAPHDSLRESLIALLLATQEYGPNVAARVIDNLLVSEGVIRDE
jgi:hypothetical protein